MLTCDIILIALLPLDGINKFHEINLHIFRALSSKGFPHLEVDDEKFFSPFQLSDIFGNLLKGGLFPINRKKKSDVSVGTRVKRNRR